MLAESWIRVLDDASFAVLFDRPVALDRDLAVLDVELLQPPAVVRDGLDAAVRNHITISQAKLLQIGTAFGERAQAGIADVTLADVEGPQPGTGPGEHVDRIVADRLAASGVQIAHLVAAPGDHLEASVRHLVTLGHREIAQRCTQLGQLVQAKVRDVGAVRYAQLA